MSFADGFTKGFGLIQDAKNSAREAELRQQQLDDTNAYRQGMLGLTQAENEAANEYRTDSLAEEIRANKEREKAAAKLAENQQTNMESRLRTEENKSKTDLTDAERRALDAKKLRQKEERLEAEKRGALAMQDLTEQIRRVDNGELSASSLVSVIEDIQARTEGTTFDLSTMLDPATLQNAEMLQAELQSGNVSMETLARAANNFLASSNKNGVGEVVNDNFVNAPDWMRREGNLTVTNKQIVDMQEGKDAEGNAVLYGQVRVTVTNPQGDEFYYTAPLTESREGDTAKFGAASVGGQAVALNVNDLLNGYRGYINAATYIHQFKPKIDDAVERNRYSENAVAYDTAFANNKQYYIDQAQQRPQADSPVPGLTMDQLRLDEGALNDLARHETLYPGSKQRDNSFRYDTVMATVRGFKEVESLERQLSRDLSVREIEELAGYIDEGSQGLFISDKTAFNNFRNRLIPQRRRSRKQARDGE